MRLLAGRCVRRLSSSKPMVLLSSKLPNFIQFSTVGCCPFDDEAEHTRRQRTFKHRQGIDCDDRPLLTVSDMKVGRRMIVDEASNPGAGFTKPSTRVNG